MPATKLSDIQAYQSPWLKASDLQGRPATVVVEKVAVEDIRQQNGAKEARVVVDFRGKAKRLICNKTQAQSFADIARKHAGQAAYLAGKIQSGGAGAWGEIPMPPQNLPDADLQALAAWLAAGARP